MKRLLSILLVLSLVMTPVLAAGSDLLISPAPADPFTVLRIPYREGEPLEWRESNALRARYADDGTPIPLSLYYDGAVYATVPTQNAQREIEVFSSVEMDFTDYDETHYEFSVMQDLSRVGVFCGNDLGQALPFANLRRSEATAILTRMLGLTGLDGIPASSFADVSADIWYADAAAAAEAYSIITGEDGMFQADRDVTRQEFVAMTARAVWAAGLAEQPQEATLEMLSNVVAYEDSQEIADWALAAYLTLESYVPADHLEAERLGENGEPAYGLYAKPHQAITRAEAADLLNQVITHYQLYPSAAAIALGLDKGMPSIDGSTSSYEFTDSVYRALFHNGYRHPSRPAEHSKSHASYERLIDGKVDLLFAAISPSQDIVELAKEKGVELELIPIALDAMVFFTNMANPTKGLTRTQLTDIYTKNSYDNWSGLGGPDALLYPYCRNVTSGSHAYIEQFILDGGEIHPDILAETTSVSMSNVLTDVMGAMTDDPLGYGMGYSIYYYFQNMDLFYGTLSELKLLAIDGVAPTEETIADGSYPLSGYAYVVLRSDTPADAPARKLAEFMGTPAGQQCVVNAGYGVLPIEE